MDMILSKLQEIVEDRAWHATVHGIARLEHYLVTEQQHKLQEGAGRSERQGRKGKIHPTECRVPENSTERKEGLLK